MSGGAATATRPTLGKLGADLRWLLEKSGVDPESGATVIMVLEKEDLVGKIVATFEAEFDPRIMTRMAGNHQNLVVHGVKIGLAVRESA